MSPLPQKPSGFIKRVVLRAVSALVLLSALFFVPAGTFLYWQAWVYMGILFSGMTAVGIWLYRADPELLDRRTRTKETEPEQKRFVKVSSVVFLLLLLVPGLDHRFGWSSVPVAVVVFADVLVLLGYGLFAEVLRENSYASRVIEVATDQKVVSTGLYGHVRHPMYSAVLLMFFATPLALGSAWALLPALTLPLLLRMRILNEEEVLARDLEGYSEYMKKVRYRLIPHVW